MVRCQMVLLDSSAKDRISSTLYVYHIALEMIKCMCWWCRWDVRLSLNILLYPNTPSSLLLKRHLLRKLVYLVVVLQLVMELWPRLPELMVSFLSISLLLLLCRLGFSTREDEGQREAYLELEEQAGAQEMLEITRYKTTGLTGRKLDCSCIRYRMCRTFDPTRSKGKRVQEGICNRHKPNQGRMGKEVRC